MPTIHVTLPADQYVMTIEPGMLARLGEVAARHAPHTRALLALDAALIDTHARVAEQSLRSAGYDVATIHITAAETQKTLQTVQRIYSVMLAHRLTRTSPVIALGGGLVGDVAGFAAATYLRGVPLIQVPTTLLAMVDAAIGGKTGVNAPLPDGGLGKNLIGAFWQPRAVLADPNVLQTLDERHLRCGLAECIKHAMIADAALLEVIERDAPDLLAKNLDSLSSLIARSAAVKVNIVQEDVREAGSRALLNLGHTFAHAIEPIASLNLHHGEAVAIGLYAATMTASLLGRCAEDYPARVQAALTRVGLPTRLPEPVAASQLMQAMAYDKKVLDRKLRLILPIEPGRAEIVDDVPPQIIEQAWRHVGAS